MAFGSNGAEGEPQCQRLAIRALYARKVGLLPDDKAPHWRQGGAKAVRRPAPH